MASPDSYSQRDTSSQPERLSQPSPAGSSKSHAGSQHHAVPPKIRRRNRLITSCLECRRRKLKCDKLHPCSNCTRFSRDCVFLAPALDAASQLRLAEIKEKMGSLERTLEEDIARKNEARQRSDSRPGSKLPGLEDVSGEEDASELEEERGLEPTPLAIEDAPYDDNMCDDNLVDLGVQFGRMRITERIGGFVRPKLAQELTEALKEVPELFPDPNEPHPSSRQIHPSSYLMPGPDYLAPSANFFFAPSSRKHGLLHSLPAKSMADTLLKQYWLAVHPVATTVHRPSFERQYASFWKDISNGLEPRASLQALVLAAMLSASVSLSEDTVTTEYGTTKAELVENFKEGTEAALSRANVVRTTKLETLQAFVMYLIPLCRTEVSRAHSALTAMAIRLAECMGLHRDAARFGISAVETHVRRLVWYQLCFLDIRVCEASGPRPQIREDDFDTKFPLNVNDADFESSTPPTKDADHFTDMTIVRMRFECTEMARLVWFERPRIEKKQTTLTAVLAKIQNFRSAMEKRYGPILDVKNPLHHMWQLVYNILSLRLILMVMHRYSSNMSRVMPDRLRTQMLNSATLLIENAIALDTHPSLKPWVWYGGAHQQWHTGLLLMAEVYAKEPHPSYEERVWRCLDYVFELPPAMSIIDKAKYIISGIRDRTLVYQSIRRMRAPTDMDQPMGPRPYTTAINHAARFWYPTMAKSQRARTGSPTASDPSASAVTTPAMQAAYAQMGNQGMSTQASSASSSAHVSPNVPHAPHPHAEAKTPPSRYDMGGADDHSRHQGYGQQAAHPMAAPAPYGMPNMFNMSPGDTGSMGSGGVGGSPGDEAMLEIDWVRFLSSSVLALNQQASVLFMNYLLTSAFSTE
ncbi:putative transcriptional regulatory protein [Diplodia seriata]|uniref:Putative transcriptional regulatory protein n=1 Tax=Diplodia seriata TaxID=420778 RepID=A0A1S8BEH4_9PEZI|nr:putative transcriptional regulatory protein [Diplodia seriata]